MTRVTRDPVARGLLEFNLAEAGRCGYVGAPLPLRFPRGICAKTSWRGDSMSEQKKPKIDLKARLGKKTVGAAPAPGASVPPPVGIPKPPSMGGPAPSYPPQQRPS